MFPMQGNQPDDKLYVDDVFSAYTYTGNGSTQTITNGIDLAGKGGLVWMKQRTGANGHNVYDTTQGATNKLATNEVNASSAVPTGLTAFSSSGFSLGAFAETNLNSSSFVSWSFRNADKFFSHTSVVKSSGSNATVSFPGLGTLGMVAVKRTDSTGSWYVWHRSLTAGNLLYLEQTAAETTLGHITVSGTTVTLVNGVIADGTYIVYAWAHDTASDGIIQCGSFTTDGSGNATVTLGWEPQYLEYKRTDAASDWFTLDTARGWSMGNDGWLSPNTALAENTASSLGTPTATGFYAEGIGASRTYIYLAIRRPNKPPTVGAQVYNAIARTGTGAATTVTGVGFAPDLSLICNRATFDPGRFAVDRLRGATQSSRTHTTGTEQTLGTTEGRLYYDVMDGIALSADSAGHTNYSAQNYINHFFKRAPGFFDEVCDTGTGAAHTVSHNLTVTPELMIRKGRSGATQWEVWHSAIANTEKLILNSTAAKATDTTAWNSTSPTASVFTVGTGANVNTNTATYVTYLFATLSGISKCGSYTGNGSSQTINCGFTTGARFILIKRTDSTGDWYVWDSTRGIVAGNDPHLSLNTTVAEVTSDDSIDPASSGFIVNQLAATNINVTSASYVFLAIA